MTSRFFKSVKIARINIIILNSTMHKEILEFLYTLKTLEMCRFSLTCLHFYLHFFILNIHPLPDFNLKCCKIACN